MSNVAVGLDLGSTNVKMVAIDDDSEMLWNIVEPTEPRMEDQIKRLINNVSKRFAPNSPKLVATGYGRKLVGNAARAVTEIACHAKGVYKSLEQGGTIIDIGGQDSKVIALDAGGNVRNFTMNDKCAAGTGRFLEVMAARLGLTIDVLGDRALAAKEEVTISSTCTVFAESEIVSLLARGQAVDHILRGLIRALVSRVVALTKSIHPTPPFMLSGGVAQNQAVVEFVSHALSERVQLPRYPQLMGAYGAALLAAEG